MSLTNNYYFPVFAIISHNPEVAGSNPVPATNKSLKSYDFSDLYFYNFFGGLFLAIEN